MAQFSYRARKFSGESVSGEIEAGEISEARRLVSRNKLIVLEISEKKATAKFGSNSKNTESSSRSYVSGPLSENPAVATLQKIWTDFFPPAKPDEVMLLFQQLQTIYSVGISLVKGLQILADQTENLYLKEILIRTLRDVSEGRSVSEALEKYPEVFDEITINLLKAGEFSGQLDEMLERIATIYQQRLESTAKMKSAFFYPKIVLGMVIVVFGIIVYFVIPKFKEFFSRFGGDLPLLTKIMMAISEFFTSYWYAVLGVICVFYWSFKTFISQPEGLRKFHAFVLRVPIFGKIFLQGDLVNFCMILEVLLRSGVPIVTSLEIVRGSVTNVLLRDDIARTKSGIEEGRTLRAGLTESEIIPGVAANLIGIGEEGGALERALNRMAAYYKLQLDTRMANISKAIEPILLIFVFSMVLCLALAVFLPMWKMNSLIKR